MWQVQPLPPRLLYINSYADARKLAQFTMIGQDNDTFGVCVVSVPEDGFH